MTIRWVVLAVLIIFLAIIVLLLLLLLSIIIVVFKLFLAFFIYFIDLLLLLHFIFLIVGDHLLNDFINLFSVRNAQFSENIEVQKLETLNIVEAILCEHLHLFLSDRKMLKKVNLISIFLLLLVLLLLCLHRFLL